MRLHPILLLLTLITTSCSRGDDVVTEPLSGIRLTRIDSGEFTMGSPPSERGHQPNETPHRAVISRPYYLGVTEVTQAQWERVMGSNPSSFRDPAAPVEQVSWNEVQEFLKRINKGATGPYRLPTEAEWEYACRAESARAYAFGDELTTSQANYDGRYPLAKQARGDFRGKTLKVASFQPNAWGLYDMHGNVWEWCADDYCPYSELERSDPFGKCASGLKVIRGGSWYFGADSARSGLRYTHAPDLRGFSIGFRVARDGE